MALPKILPPKPDAIALNADRIEYATRLAVRYGTTVHRLTRSGTGKGHEWRYAGVPGIKDHPDVATAQAALASWPEALLTLADSLLVDPVALAAEVYPKASRGVMFAKLALIVAVILLTVVVPAVLGYQQMSGWLEAYHSEPDPESVQYWMEFGGRV
jgi:hypothetical protein